ncbi:MAG: DUF3343 domain-containing protein [Deltaproteobacteria bacterium]|jgi:hypothetical protein|nr:DUF3343 domain-containing protein [Deltaproteobacteria bacterium]
MTEAVITFHGTAATIAAEDVLLSGDLPVAVMGRPSELGSDCGFCLRVDLTDLPKAIELIKKANINIQGIYKVETDPAGKRRYTPLPDGIA